jgi:fibronectin type 3 domain-containing protein
MIMKQPNKRGEARMPSSDKTGRVVYQKVTQLSRLNSTVELLESRTMMSAGTLELPAPPMVLAATSAPGKTTSIVPHRKGVKPVTHQTAAPAVKAVVPPATGLSATATAPSSVKLTWVDIDKDAKGFLVYRSTAGAAFTLVETISSGATTTWTDTTVSSNTSYAYQVKATNGSVTSAASGVSAVTTPIGAPASLTTVVSNAGGVTLSWTDTDPSATGYAVLRSTDGVHYTTLATISTANATHYTDTTISTGHSYSYQVAATAGSHTSAVSNTATAVTPLAAPTGLTINATSSTTIVLSWVDHDTAATGYNISRSSDGKTFVVIGKVNTPTATTYSDSTVSSTHTYYYQVQAFNAVATSATVTASPVVTPLMAPTGLAANASGTSIILTWTDKDSAATGYLVLRSTDGHNFSQLAQLASATASTYADASGTPGQKYYYQVQAVSDSVKSAVSNTAFATLTTSPTVPPGNSTVTLATRYGNELVITLTGADDTVSVSQSGSILTIVANGQTATQAVPAAGLFIYTRGGTDGIHVDQSVTVRTTIETIDSAVDTISSSSADVSLWDDSGDIFTGMATVHTVSSFAGGVSKATGASLADPSDSGTIMHAGASLWGSGPVAGDVNQGNSGDCYFLSSLAAFAGVSPARLEQSAVDMGDGTYTVDYISNGSPEYVRVSNDLPTHGATAATCTPAPAPAAASGRRSWKRPTPSSAPAQTPTHPSAAAGWAMSTPRWVCRTRSYYTSSEAT